jgi:hypothetical protein
MKGRQSGNSKYFKLHDVYDIIGEKSSQKKLKESNVRHECVELAGASGNGEILYPGLVSSEARQYLVFARSRIQT